MHTKKKRGKFKILLDARWGAEWPITGTATRIALTDLVSRVECVQRMKHTLEVTNPTTLFLPHQIASTAATIKLVAHYHLLI